MVVKQKEQFNATTLTYLRYYSAVMSRDDLEWDSSSVFR